MRLFLETRPEDVGAAVFDKDDDLAVEFVTAASNLRSLCYNIPTQSLFAAKVHILFSFYKSHMLHEWQSRGYLQSNDDIILLSCR